MSDDRYHQMKRTELIAELEDRDRRSRRLGHVIVFLYLAFLAWVMRAELARFFTRVSAEAADG